MIYDFTAIGSFLPTTTTVAVTVTDLYITTFGIYSLLLFHSSIRYPVICYDDTLPVPGAIGIHSRTLHSHSIPWEATFHDCYVPIIGIADYCSSIPVITTILAHSHHHPFLPFAIACPIIPFLGHST